MIIGSFALFYWKYSEGIVRQIRPGKTEIIKNFGEALYFSIVTFTSLGYGDFRPNHNTYSYQWIKYICCAEALLGVFSLAIVAAIFFKFMAKK